MLKGIPASPGIAFGKVFLKETINTENLIKESENPDKELKILKEALSESISELLKLKEKTLKSMGSQHSEIFEAHKMILEDTEYTGAIENKIKDKKYTAAYAVITATEEIRKIFAEIPDEYLRERAADVKDVGERVLKNILGIKTELSELEEKVIVVADELTPSDTADMDKEKILGFITAKGGRTSHTAIIARTLGIPAVVGAKEFYEKVRKNDSVVLNGETGEIFINPNEEILETFKKEKERISRINKILDNYSKKETVTKDGKKPKLYANIASSKDAGDAFAKGAEGVGLFRTEFIYMNRKVEPSEEEQFVIYRNVLEEMKGKPVIIRTLDIGGDKEVEYLNFEKEDNPFLGYRAIRICLDRKEMFKKQLKAILRAGVYGKAKIMFPMISSLEELREAKKITEECKKELEKEGKEFQNNTEIGIMIEIPSAAVISDMLAKECDFFSIGTNDLIQYTTAVDRMNPKISHLYNQYNPAVLRLLKTVTDNAHKNGIEVGMCGELAGDETMAYFLAGIGLDEFSMSASSVSKIRWLLSETDSEKASEDVQKIIEMDSGNIKKFLENKLSEIKKILN